MTGEKYNEWFYNSDDVDYKYWSFTQHPFTDKPNNRIVQVFEKAKYIKYQGLKVILSSIRTSIFTVIAIILFMFCGLSLFAITFKTYYGITIKEPSFIVILNGNLELFNNITGNGITLLSNGGCPDELNKYHTITSHQNGIENLNISGEYHLSNELNNKSDITTYNNSRLYFSENNHYLNFRPKYMSLPGSELICSGERIVITEAFFKYSFTQIHLVIPVVTMFSQVYIKKYFSSDEELLLIPEMEYDNLDEGRLDPKYEDIIPDEPDPPPKQS